MLPYIEQPHFHLGPLPIHGFGILVALAVLIGSEILRRRAVAVGLSGALAQRLVTWVLVGGFLGAHLVDRFIYFPRETMEDPQTILMIWQGISSFGGFLGGTLGAVWFLRREKLGPDVWRYLDVVAYALPFGWVFGRTGCFVAFDHPGIETTFWLGERFTDGRVHHNLGFYEALYTILICVVVYVCGRKPRAPGFFVALLAIVYTPFRFAIDYLRIRDARYLGLTPAQYGAVAAFLLGVWILRRGRAAAASVPAQPSTP